MRLSRARMRNGIKSRRLLADLTRKHGLAINHQRIGRLERDETDPTIPEIQILCQALKMSSDWWLMGDETAPELICRRVKELSKRHREAILLILDLLGND